MLPKIDYQLLKTRERLGPIELEIERLENLDQTIDQVFSILEAVRKPELLSQLCPYFGVIWPSGRALAEYLAALPAGALAGKTILELGCGLALPSLVAAKLGAQVTSVDYHPEVKRFLEANVRANGITGLRYLECNWEESGALPPEQFDWVLGSDILYERSHAPDVARAFASKIKLGGTAILADPGRPYLQEFSDLMGRHGKSGTTLIRNTLHDEKQREIFLLQFG